MTEKQPKQPRICPLCNHKRPATTGRPTLYTSKYVNQAYKLCLLNITNEQLASYFDISISTLKGWIAKYPKFSTAIKKGKEIADSKVALSLFERATGYSHPEEKIFCHEGKIIRTQTTKHYPPDTAAAFIWLKNRAGWRDKQEFEHDISKDMKTIMGLIDGDSKGKLPEKAADRASKDPVKALEGSILAAEPLVSHTGRARERNTV